MFKYFDTVYQNNLQQNFFYKIFLAAVAKLFLATHCIKII